MAEVNPVPDPEAELEEEGGVEVEAEDASEIKRPFDPEKIKVRTIPVVVDQIVSRIDHEEIDLAPDFQRMAGIWNDQRKSRLIESLLLRIPIPVFYVAADDNETWSVVDGLQRTSTIYNFVKGKFCLSQLEYLDKLVGCAFEELPRSMQRRIRETQLVMNVIEPGTPREVMFNIFRRINTGGMTLNGQEIRHALHPDPVRTFLKTLANADEFLRATRRTIKTDRMADRECVLRFLAFHIDPWEQYYARDLDGYLSQAMVKINGKNSKERDSLSADFKKAMLAANKVFGKYAFRKFYSKRGRRGPINKALFETWGVGFARRSDDEIASLVGSRETVMNEFIELVKTDWKFERAISSSTGTPARVRERFQAIDELIKRCL